METKFTKSQSNARTENRGLSLLLTDDRFRWVDTPTKRRIIELVVGKTTSYGIQTFDAIMVPTETPLIHVDNVDQYIGDIRLVEMKSTRKPIKNDSLSGFFFGATQREYNMAKELGNRYMFGFIVLNNTNVFNAPFAVLLTLDQVEQRTHSKRVQYQVNFKTDMEVESGEHQTIVFGSEEHIPRAEDLN